MLDINAVIFDRDGVLADFDYDGTKRFFENLSISLEELAQQWQNWGELFGFPSNLEEERLFFEGFWSNLGKELHIPEKNLNQYRKFNYAEYLLLFPDAKDILAWLKAKGIRIGVLTNFTLASVKLSLKTLGIWEYIDVACGATTIGIAKPNPKAYKIVMNKLETDPGKTIFFDDDIGHVNGARNAGIVHSYYVNRSAQDHDLSNREVKDLSVIKGIIERTEHE
jgi:putative hydrolase of the HAD superfamily